MDEDEVLLDRGLGDEITLFVRRLFSSFSEPQKELIINLRDET